MTKDTRLDKETYEAAKTYLKAALEHMLETGRSARDLSEFALERFGDAFLPYLREFSKDVSRGRIEITGLTQSARTAILGHHVTLEEREKMIRNAAYFLAERRGFTGGSVEDDWRAAEQEIDEQLSREAGLVEKGREVLNSATSIVEKELNNVKQLVASWMEERHGEGKKKKTPAKKKKAPAKKSTATAKKAATGKKSAVNKTNTKKSTAKSTAKKAAVKKTASKKKATAKKTGGKG